MRLVVFREGVPEVDHALEELDPLDCQREIRACIAAWQARVWTSSLGWWFTVPPKQVAAWLPLVDGAAGECRLNQPLSVWAEPWGQGTVGDWADVLSPLQQLAMLALHQEER